MEHPANRPNHPRPYWHVDAKWVCGIIFALGLWVALVLHSLAAATTEQVAVPAATQVIAQLFSPQGLDDPGDIGKLKEEAARQPEGIVHPLPGTTITRADLDSLSPRELRLKIFGQLVKPYYQLGVKGVAAQQTNDPKERESIEKQAGLLALINRQTHDWLQSAFLISLAALVLPLAGLVYFSYRFGRLASPGFILTLVPLPAMVVGSALLAAGAGPPTMPGQSGGAAALPPEALKLILQAVLPALWSVVAAGVALLLAAGIGRLIWRHRTTHSA